MSLNPQNIWLERQNKPTLIVRDLAKVGVSTDVAYSTLLRRGVFKWLAARRDIIKAKDIWKAQLRQAHKEIMEAKERRDWKKVQYLRGRIRALEECRGLVRSICHSERWRAPDFDREAQRWLEKQV